jgi:broad specificity phosphatase PhoE
MIALARHGQALGAAGRAVGRLNLPLSGPGREQARELAAALADVPWAALYCSPLLRARDTLAPLAAAAGLVPTVLDDLAEISLGDWEGLEWERIRRDFPQDYAARGQDLAGFRPPGGESFADLARRAGRAWEAMAAGPRPALALTHAGVIRVLLCTARGLPLDQIFSFQPAEAQAALFQIGPRGPVLAGHNLAPRELRQALRA